MRHPEVRKRSDLTKLFTRLGFKAGAEIGVLEGKFSEFLCNNIPNLRLYCIDPWTSYSGYTINGDNEKQEERYNIVKNRFGNLPITIIRRTSMDAVKTIPDHSLDFVYIDANHDFDYVMEDIIEWTRKVRVGGIVAGHDYFHFPEDDGGVVQAVDAYVAAHRIYPLYLTEDRETTWFWVNRAEHEIHQGQHRKAK